MDTIGKWFLEVTLKIVSLPDPTVHYLGFSEEEIVKIPLGLNEDHRPNYVAEMGEAQYRLLNFEYISIYSKKLPTAPVDVKISVTWPHLVFVCNNSEIWEKVLK